MLSRSNHTSRRCHQSHHGNPDRLSRQQWTRTAEAPAVKDEEQISKDQDERDEARQDLRKTLTVVNEKVERAAEEFRPDHLIPVGASLVAGALGFVVGSIFNKRGTSFIMVAAVLGFALSIRSSREAGDNDDGQASFTR
jgi:hypothetical protein